MIQHIDLVNFTHTDVGYTDDPSVCRELHMRYLDIAVDAALATRDKPESARYCWTAEVTLAVDDWWQAATPERRKDFLKAVDSGQLDIAALAINNTPFMNRDEWHKMLHWLPEELWQQIKPKVAIQNDVNGLPRAGALCVLDRGIHRYFTSINEESGGPPFARPSAFWWKMPDGRRLFVYLNYTYPMGYWFFDPVEWRRGPVPRAADTRYRPPRRGDFFACDEASMQKAHGQLMEKLRGLDAVGYSYPSLLISITNQWRIDNDPPLLLLPDFVDTWNRMNLKPTLRLTTVSEAMRRLEEEIGSQIPEHQGEWTDWWANGTACAPREVSASRIAKRLLEAAQSPIWGEMSENARRAADNILRDLCLCDEHTWGSINSAAMPYTLDSQAQFIAKAVLAYRPMGRAEWLLSQRVRSRLVSESEGMYVANTAPTAWSGWVRMLAAALRDDYRSLENPATGERHKIYFENGLSPYVAPQSPDELTYENTAATFPDNCPNMLVKFWVDGLPGQEIRKLQLSKNEIPDDPPPPVPGPRSTVDAHGWPTSITWPGMTKPLFLPGMGNLIVVRIKGFAPRWIARKMHDAPNDAEREKLRREFLEETTSTGKEKCSVSDNPHTIVYTQRIEHSRLLWGTRQLEVWKGEPRARLAMRLNRTSCESPEVFYVDFPLPCESTMPRTSCGGQEFVPYIDQLPGTCRDYFAIDEWVNYSTPAGNWLWTSHDAPLVAFGCQHVKARHSEPPKEPGRVLSMIFDNIWFTNFVSDSHGVMEFRFDLAWQKETPASVEGLARTLASEPQVMINPGLKEDPIIMKRLYET